MTTNIYPSPPPAPDADAVTHELRSAFANLRMATQLLQRRLGEPTLLPERLQETSTTLIAQLERVETTLMHTLRNGARHD